MVSSSDDVEESVSFAGPESTNDERYRTISTGGDEVVIYDTNVKDAWVQSDITIEPREMR